MSDLFIILKTTTCDNLFTPDALKIMNDILLYFRIIAPILLILLTSIDLFKIVMTGDKEKSVVSNVVKRSIAVMLLFLVPTIVAAIINLDGVKSTLEIDPLCLKATGTESTAKNVYEIFGISDKETKKEHSSSSDSSGNVDDNNNEVSTFGECEAYKRCRKTVTIKGRTYDSYLQGDFPDVGFSGENIVSAGCSCVAFVQAASGFNRDITIFQGATMFRDRTFDGIASALRQEGIPYSSIIYYNSNDYENSANGKTRAAQVVSQVREHLNQGKPAIAIVQGAPYAGANPHFITLFGEDENGNLICGNCRKEVGSLEELVANSLQGGRKGFMLVG